MKNGFPEIFQKLSEPLNISETQESINFNFKPNKSGINLKLRAEVEET